MKKVLAIACVALALGGCAGRVGVTADQSLKGQAVTNSGMDSVTVADNPAGDGTGTTTVNGTAPVFISNSDASGQSVRATGTVPTTISLKRPDGAEFTMFSGKDARGSLKAEGVDVNWDTSASAVLDSVARVRAVEADILKAIALAQADVEKTVSENQKQTISAVFDSLRAAAQAYISTIRPDNTISDLVK